MGLHRARARARQPPARRRLPEHRLYALHSARRRGRRPARGPVERFGEDRMRTAQITEPGIEPGRERPVWAASGQTGLRADAPVSLTHLDQLENQSIYIFREAYHAFSNICMPWSMGKDSNVLIWLAKKAFCGHIPFPVLHIDTTYEFPEMLEFREWATKEYGLNLIVKINEEARWG